ncbi:TetR/AcrR family transcriptional regulator [Bradyrhizobium ontarionense]|uniref:TetR/AcrR family transcriptional regulator n=1 Tax=Bradyrhizobium ontarionense TaxID=2898149 RepID=A0ABY3RCV0_9BRAD|nr:TetR/AcrR family transcriptional regulator [Bradyrhizobium sp. A19]UFZ05061.1 TetR/AcrR family transcriptional regulator [Bradyrhizobium sp. A19]
MEANKGRRRGDALETAILDAAWAELLEAGYSSFTVEAVAKRARTSRPVLARRWPGRADLAVAALAHYNRTHPVEMPDLGNVRDELILILQKLSERGASTVMKVVLTMNDYFAETNSSIADLRARLVGENKFEQVLRRGVARGELDQGRLTSRISSLPLDLLRHELIMTRMPVSKELIVEIVDTIFLPLAAARTAG